MVESALAPHLRDLHRNTKVHLHYLAEKLVPMHEGTVQKVKDVLIGLRKLKIASDTQGDMAPWK